MFFKVLYNIDNKAIKKQNFILMYRKIVNGKINFHVFVIEKISFVKLFKKEICNNKASMSLFLSSIDFHPCVFVHSYILPFVYVHSYIFLCIPFSLHVFLCIPICSHLLLCYLFFSMCFCAFPFVFSVFSCTLLQC